MTIKINIMNIVLLSEPDFVENEPCRARLSGRRKKHIVSVCKVSVGSKLRVGMVNGKTGNGEVLSVSDDFIDLRVELNEQPPAPLPLTLIISLPRPKSFIKCIEAATVHGVKKIFFINSRRVEKDYWGNKMLSEDAVMEHILLGLEQARDTVLPHIELRKRLKPFIEDELPEIIEGTKAFIAHPYSGNMCPYHVDGQITLAIGPEGGFIPYEIDLFKNIGFTDVSFGERILRVEHAVSALIGRLL